MCSFLLDSEGRLGFNPVSVLKRVPDTKSAPSKQNLNLCKNYKEIKTEQGTEGE